MSDEAASQEGGEESASSGGGSKLPMILALLNTLAVLGVLGSLFYTQVIFKRPAITEKAERKRLAEAHSTASASQGTEKGLIPFETVTLAIQRTSPQPPPLAAPGGGQVPTATRPHYATIGFALEVRDLAQKPKVDELKPVFMDKLLSLLGGKTFNELTSVQGRYLLRAEIAGLANQLLGQDLVTNVFFTDFVVQ